MEAEHSFGAWVRRRRRALGLTQGEVARLVGCAEVTVQKIEADERRPSAQVAALLARHLRLPAEQHAPFAAAARGELAVGRLPAPVVLDAAPAEPAPDAPAHNLPLELTSFVGRERELAEVAALLAEARLLTLTGPGGTGKTRLALRVAGEALPRFPDGVRLIELAPLADPALIVKAVAEAQGLQEDPGRPLLRTLIDALQRRRLLLLLDNCEHLIDACAQLAAALLQACPTLTVLASSREPLGVPGERVFRVPAMALPEPDSSTEALAAAEAVQLFVARARAAEPTFAITAANAAALARLCRRLDGIPLALELAAVRVRHLTVAQIAERLDESFRLLTGGARTALPRHQTLRALIDWSYALLDPAERALLGRLAMFAGGWSLEAAEAVCAGAPVEDPLETLGRLTDKSLVQVERDRGLARYHMLETIRQYALEKLAASGEADAVRERHARFLVATAPPLGGSWGMQSAWLAWARREQENLRVALAWAETAEGTELLMLGLACHLATVRGILGFAEEACAMLGRALRAGEGQVGSEPHLRASYVLAHLLGHIGELESSYNQSEGLLALCRASGDQRAEVDVLERLGWVRREQGDAVAAEALLAQGVALARALGLEERRLGTLNTLAGVAVLREDAQTARELLEPSLAHAPHAPHPLTTGWALNHLGHTAQLVGDYALAEQLHQESITWFVQVGTERTECFTWTYQSLGETALGRGDVATARERFARGLRLSHEIQNHATLAWCLAGLGTAAAHAEEPERAARLWGAAERLRLALGCRPAPAARATYERALALVRAQLGAEAFAAEWDAGAALPLQAALDEALALAAAP